MGGGAILLDTMYLPPLYIFPLLSGLLLPLTFFLAYIISVSLGHAEWGWPYISDTTTRPPESCVFSQMVNIGALLLAVTFYIRYKQVSEYCSSYQIPRRLSRLNKFCLAAGWGAAAGLSIFANFQETEVSQIHWIGFYLCFVLSLVWTWATVLASYSLHPISTSKVLLFSRLFLACCYSLTMAVMLVAGAVAKSKFDGKDPTKWSPEDGGWNWHCASTGSEWLMALSMDLIILSLVPEFRRIGLEAPRIRLIIDRTNSVLDVTEDDLEAGYASSSSMLA